MFLPAFIFRLIKIIKIKKEQERKEKEEMKQEIKKAYEDYINVRKYIF